MVGQRVTLISNSSWIEDIDIVAIAFFVNSTCLVDVATERTKTLSNIAD